MLPNNEAFSSFSVDDVAQARAFYSQTLGLEVSESDDVLELVIANGSKVLIYLKPNHTAASFTVLNFPVDDIAQTMAELVKHGVRFEHYQGEFGTDEQGIYKVADMAIKWAWFKDPAGNILSLIETR